MRQVMQKAQELAETIIKSEIYLSMKEKENEMLRNAEACALLNNMNNKRQRVENILSSSDMNQTELVQASQDMEAAEKAMLDNPLIQEVKKARADFQTMMDNINQILRLVITGETEETKSARGSCSGNCGSCRGCN